MLKQHYREGDWVAIPLVEHGGWGLGLIARTKAPALIGYFFGPRRAHPPKLEDAIGLRPEDAILTGSTSDMGIRNGEWIALGGLPGWDRRNWPMVKFGQVEGPRAYLCTYDENDPNRMLRRDLVPAEQIEGLPRAGTSGHVALSIKLDNAIAKKEARSAA
jgi:hypothetical protein